jgi:hypothetical protein
MPFAILDGGGCSNHPIFEDFVGTLAFDKDIILIHPFNITKG